MKTKFGLFTAISLVVANMVGTGVFTSLGFQAKDLSSAVPILLLWLLGGLVAISGALCYGELGAAFPRSGGEYNYLSSIYHPSIGFISGWVSVIAGFPAPIALSAIAFGRYFSSVFETANQTYVALILVIFISIMHSFSKKIGKNFQNFFTIVKVFLIGILIFSGLALSNSTESIWSNTDLEKVYTPAFAVSLIYVSYSYSGWNASAYLAGELEKPEKNVFLSVVIGTSIVMFLYIVLNYVFLYTVPISELSGRLEIGHIFSEKIFGTIGGKLMSLTICLLLLSSVSSLILIGPRILKTMAEDYSIFRYLSTENTGGSPYLSILFQLGIVICYIITSSFEAVLSFIAFTLDAITTLTVAGIFVIRKKQIKYHYSYKVPGYPFTPLFFITVNLWVMYYLLQNRFVPSMMGLLLLFSGSLVYWFTKRRSI